MNTSIARVQCPIVQTPSTFTLLLPALTTKLYTHRRPEHDKTILPAIIGLLILGVSVDSAQSHKDFCAKEGLAFKLLADPDAKVSTEYGSTTQYQGATMAARNTFLINPEGKIAKVYTGVKPAEHSEQVLKDLTELKKS